MPMIPHSDSLFQRYFVPWYPDNDLASRVFAAMRPDLLQLSGHIGKAASTLSPLQDEDQERYLHHLTVTMTEAAVGDFGNLTGLSSPVGLDWIQTIDEYYHCDRIAELIGESDPAEDGNPYFIRCIELGTLIASTLQSLVPELEWMADSPYWESSLWHPASGHIIPPTHWAIRKFSDCGRDDGLVPRIHCCVHILREGTNSK